MERSGTFPRFGGPYGTMRLDSFVQRHPDAVVGRPDLTTPLVGAALSALGALIAAAFTLAGLLGGAGLASIIAWLLVATVAASGLCRWGPRLTRAHALFRDGRASYAISDDEILLVDGRGATVLVELDLVTELTLEGDEPHLRADSELQAHVYSIMFDLFSGQPPHPSGQRFFEVLAPRVRARCPHAHVERRMAIDEAFVS